MPTILKVNRTYNKNDNIPTHLVNTIIYQKSFKEK